MSSGGRSLISKSASGRSVIQRLLVDHQRLVPLMVFVLVVVATVLGVVSIERGARAREQARMARAAVAAASSLERRATINASYLRAAAAVFALQPTVGEEVFRRFVGELRLENEDRGTEAIGWAPVRSDDGQMRVPVAILEPSTAQNRQVIGFDMYADPVRRAAMQQAARTMRPTASGGVVLAGQAPGGRRRGFLIFMPVFGGEGATRQLRGFIYSPYDAAAFLTAASRGLDLEGLRLSLYDGGQRGRGELLGSMAGGRKGSGKSLSEDVVLANRAMTVRVTSLRAGALSMTSVLTLLFGLALAFLLMLVLHLLTKQFVEDQRALAWFAEQNAIRNSLTRELNHRVKNTLANVLSIVTLTRRRATSLDEFADGLDGRIRALSATHDLLTQSDWGTTPIEAVVTAELAPYTRAGEDVLDMSGPRVELAPNDALSLGLALHELATNASKYGALSVPGGRVAVRWSVIGENLAQIEWAESGGPPVSPSRSRGFGTDLIEKIVAHELRNPVALEFAAEGVRCSLKVPVRQPADFSLRARPRGAGV